MVCDKDGQNDCGLLQTRHRVQINLAHRNHFSFYVCVFGDSAFNRLIYCIWVFLFFFGCLAFHTWCPCRHSVSSLSVTVWNGVWKSRMGRLSWKRWQISTGLKPAGHLDPVLKRDPQIKNSFRGEKCKMIFSWTSRKDVVPKTLNTRLGSLVVLQWWHEEGHQWGQRPVSLPTSSRASIVGADVLWSNFDYHSSLYQVKKTSCLVRWIRIFELFDTPWVTRSFQLKKRI